MTDTLPPAVAASFRDPLADLILQLVAADHGYERIDLVRRIFQLYNTATDFAYAEGRASLSDTNGATA